MTKTDKSAATATPSPKLQIEHHKLADIQPYESNPNIITVNTSGIDKTHVGLR